jgi:hypothetical protein
MASLRRIFWKANVSPELVKKVLNKSDISFSGSGMQIKINTTKTIQFGEHLVCHRLCPVQAGSMPSGIADLSQPNTLRFV